MYRGSPLLSKRSLPFLGRLFSQTHGSYCSVSNLAHYLCGGNQEKKKCSVGVKRISIAHYNGIVSSDNPNEKSVFRRFGTASDQIPVKGISMELEEHSRIGNGYDKNPHESTFDTCKGASKILGSGLKLPQTVSATDISSKNGTKKSKQRRRPRNRQRKEIVEREPSEWVTIAEIPKFAVLRDILIGVEDVLISNEEIINEALNRDLEQDFGENDIKNGAKAIFSEAHEPKSLREFQKKHNLPSHLVKEARMILSKMKRPAGWFLRFPSPTVAKEFARAAGWNETHESQTHAFESSNRKMKVGSKVVKVDIAVNPHRNRAFAESVEGLNLDDSVVRMERVHRNVSESAIRAFFRTHLLAEERFGCSAVQKVVHGVGTRYRASPGNPRPEYKTPPQIPDDKTMATIDSDYCTYLIRFDDPAWARAAVRARQGVPLFGERVFLMQYPSQSL